MTLRIEVPNLDNLLNRYVAGESENKLAREAGVGRGVFRRRLLWAGIKPRGRSEAELMKWSRMSPERRAAQVATAHEAVRGSKQTWEHRCKGAITRERNISGATIVEDILDNSLRLRGLSVTQQKAVGIYNIDVAIHEPRIAVEVYGGNWHSTGTHRRRHFKRCKYLLDCGWNVLVIRVDARNHPLGLGAYNYIIAFADELRSNPPVRCQYRVIFGDGSPVSSTARSYLNSPAVIEALYASD